MNKLGQVLFGAVLLSTTAVGHAGGEMYALVAVGQSTVGANLKGDIDTIATTLGATGLASTLDRSDTGVKLQVGYQLHPNFSIEGGWVDLGRARYDSSFTAALGVESLTII